QSDGEVLGHAFAEPERQQRERAALFAEDVALKRVNELVTEDVIGFAETRGERQDDAPREVVGETADAFWNVASQDRGLGEVCVTCVEDDRLPARERVVERVRQPLVPTLRQLRGDLRRAALLGVVIDVKVLRLQNRKLEAVVLHLVPAEIL